MRTRDKSRVVTQTRELVFYKKDGTIDRTSVDSASRLAWNVMEDVSDPNFKVRSNRGEVIINPMKRLVTNPVFNAVPFAVYSPEYVGGVAWKSSFFGGPLTVLQWQWPGGVYPGQVNLIQVAEEMESPCLTEAYAKVGKSDVEALVTLGELPETLAFLWSPVKKAIELTRRANRWQAYYNRRMASYDRALQRYDRLPANIKRTRTKPKVPKIDPFRWNRFEATDIPSLWLAYRYGLRPLLADIAAYSKLVQKGFEKAGATRATARATSREERTYNYNTATSGDNPKHHFENKLQVVFEIRAGVVYTPKFDVIQQLGLSMDRIPAAGYELIPLSFVADWAWNAASVYDALTAECRAMSILGAWTTTRITYDYTCTRFMDGASDTKSTYVGGTGVCLSEHGEYKVRKPRTLSDVALRLRVKLNAQRIADGLALLSQMLGGRTRAH